MRAHMALFGFVVFLCVSASQSMTPDCVDEACSQGEHVHDSDESSLLQDTVHLSVGSQPQKNKDTPVADAVSISYRAASAEFIAMTVFVFLGCGSAMGIAKEPGSAWVLQVSLTFGFAITALAYAIGHISGGHINCAVTFGLMLVRACHPVQGLLNMVVQTAGSIAGAATLCLIFPEEMDATGGVGSNSVAPGFELWNAFIGEVVMTFLLVLVVLNTAVNPKSEANRALACIAIGFAVFLAHCVLIPVDGCSINPTRTIGPALVSKIRNPDRESDALEHLWIFILGPFLGAALAAGTYLWMQTLSPPPVAGIPESKFYAADSKSGGSAGDAENKGNTVI